MYVKPYLFFGVECANVVGHLHASSHVIAHSSMVGHKEMQHHFGRLVNVRHKVRCKEVKTENASNLTECQGERKEANGRTNLSE